MSRTSSIESEAYLDFLVQLYFGPIDDILRKCIERGYFDFQRTLRGINRFEKASDIREKAVNTLKNQFINLNSTLLIEQVNQAAFDIWHEQICETIKQIYAAERWDEFYIGQAQKWINMTFKYIFALKRLPASKYLEHLQIDYLYEFCHVPLDNAVLLKLAEQGFKYDFTWSRIDNYDTYLGYQHWIRHHFPEEIPLDREFKLWDARNTGQQFSPQSLNPNP